MATYGVKLSNISAIENQRLGDFYDANVRGGLYDFDAVDEGTPMSKEMQSDDLLYDENR